MLGPCSGAGHLRVTLLALFRPRPPLEFKAPLKKPTPKLPLTGLASYVKFFAENDKPEPPKKLPDRKERKVIAKKAKAEKGARKLKEAIAKYDPKSIQGATKDPYHTLFVSRIDKVATEDNLRDAFGRYGKIEEIKLIKDPKGKSKGYAFIEYSSSREMKDAYKDADNMKILSRRVCVDVERGRTVDGWKPRRLGGGRGGEAAKQKKNASKNSAGRFGGGVSSHYQSDYRGDRRGGGGGSFRDRGWGASGDRPRYQDDRGGRGGRGGPGLGYRGDRDRSRDFERDRYNGSRGGGGDRYRERDRGDRYRDDEDRYRGGGRERKRGWDGDEGRGGGGDHGDRKRYSERSDHHRYRDRSPHERSYKRSRYAREEGEL